MGILRQINWLDILIVIILIRIVYIAFKGGLVSELFKTLGTVFAIYLSLHYYSAITNFLQQYIKLKDEASNILYFISFVGLALFGYLLFLLLRLVFSRLIKLQAVPNLDKWGGIAMGVLRGFLLASLIIFMISLSGISYLRKSISSSYSARVLFVVAPETYTFLWDSFASKFMALENFNEDIFRVRKEIDK